MFEITQANSNLMLNIGIFTIVILLMAYEWLNGKYQNNQRTIHDWQMSTICFAAAALVQRPIVFGISFLMVDHQLPFAPGAWRAFNQEHLLLCIVVFICLDEFLHGATHRFAHAKSPRSPILANIQSFIKTSHRPHHLHGGADKQGEISAAHTPVEHWAFLLMLPNYWMGALALYLGFIETFVIATLIKTAWTFHVHTNWNYDLYFLNHRKPWVRKIMFALCHLFTFPTMHHQHHSRSANSAKNMQNFLAIYDWLIWGTLAIENKRPKIYGWRQSEKEARSAWFRFFNNRSQRSA